jgi:8-oxo-dGTP diphosphatase
MSSLLPKVGVKAVIIKDQRLLVVAKAYPEGVAYILPGGGQEHGESLVAAVQRECAEELGVSVEVGRLLFVREYIGKEHQFAATDADVHIVDLLFACHVPDDYLPRLGSLPDPDQIGVTWLALSQLNAVTFYPAALQPWLWTLPSDTPDPYVGNIN